MSAFMPGDSFGERKARLALQPSMVPASCGRCGGELDTWADDGEVAYINYQCDECEIAWGSNGHPQHYERYGI